MYKKLGISVVITLQLLFVAGCGTSVPMDMAENGRTEVGYHYPSQRDQSSISQSTEESVAPEDRSEVSTLNSFRELAGLKPFLEDTLLKEAACNHAHYLVANDLYTHYESSSDDFFTGEYPSERIAAVGYPHRDIAENIYAGDVDPERAVEILFSNIYHRLAFLDFGFDAIGIGSEMSERYRYKRVYIYEMGISQSRSVNASLNPDIVLWPARDQQHVMPVFYEEEPDPLPECSVSGYPISVQFNPRKHGTIDLLSFRLFESDGEEVTDTMIMDRSNDPSGHLEEGTFVLFPLSRLKWSKRYRVEMIYREEGETQKRLSWEFTTKSLPGRVLRVERSGQRFVVRSGERCFFDLPPRGCNDKFGTYTYRYTAGMKIKERIWDNNTIQFEAIGEGEVEITPDNGRKFYIGVVR